ncbi:MAG: PKD domain-containing protein [Bacteroidota bacterium]
MKKLFTPILLLCFAATLTSCEKDQVLAHDDTISEKLPLVDYQIVPGDDPFTFKFTNKSSGFEKVEWRFGDDTLSTVESPSHVYLTTGTFQVDLKAFNTEGEFTRKLVDIKIVPDSVVKVTATKTGVANEVKFNLTSKARIVSAVWTFNDVTPGVSSTSLSPTRKYEAGSFNNFTVTIKTDKGSTIQLDKYVTSEGIADNITSSALSFVGSSDNSNTNENAAKLVDNNLETKIFLGGPPLPLTFKFQFASAQAVKIYGIGNANDSDGRDPKTWTLEGSDDDANWTVLDSRTMTSSLYTLAGNQYKKLFYFAVSNPKPFIFYRWKISATWNENNFQASEIRLFR